MSDFVEQICPGVELRVSARDMVFSGRTRFQRVDVFEHEVLGRSLALDGIVQTTESDEFIYHEMLVHTALASHGDARKVLIIGGGDGGALREVLRELHRNHQLAGVVLVGRFPDAYLVRTCNWHRSGDIVVFWNLPKQKITHTATRPVSDEPRLL